MSAQFQLQNRARRFVTRRCHAHARMRRCKVAMPAYTHAHMTEQRTDCDTNFRAGSKDKIGNAHNFSGGRWLGSR